MAQRHNQQQAAQQTPLAQRVLEELLAARKRSDGLSPTGHRRLPDHDQPARCSSS
ncbi:hypothetical protein [Actinomyces bowdenii]|uniref:hypothetical protein n=1 Tax=Actinomyces bowdenii TaxID=131109 RepID=UPI00163A8B65|nr:hypothetical protein [Actinomyces bowdenii]